MEIFNTMVKNEKYDNGIKIADINIENDKAS